MERRRLQDPDGYQVYGLGNWGELGGLILTNYEVKEFDTSINNFDSMANGQDFGLIIAPIFGDRYSKLSELLHSRCAA